MFSPDVDLGGLSGHISYMFHCMIGLDPLGDFSAIEGLRYEVEPYEYNELGRNHSPVMLPFREPGQPGELTLRWGMIIRSKLFNWMKKVQVGGDFRKNVYIFQLSQQRLPFRVYHLTGCWPKQWETSNFSTEQAAEMTSESLTLVYDQLDMLNLSAVALAGQMLASPVNELLNLHRPPGYSAMGAKADLRGSKVTYVDGKPVGVSQEELRADEDYEAVRADHLREVIDAEAGAEGEGVARERRYGEYEANPADWDLKASDPDYEAKLEAIQKLLDQQKEEDEAEAVEKAIERRTTSEEIIDETVQEDEFDRKVEVIDEVVQEDEFGDRKAENEDAGSGADTDHAATGPAEAGEETENAARGAAGQESSESEKEKIAEAVDQQDRKAEPSDGDA